MMLEEFFDYKNLLMKELCSNENIVKLVTGNDDADVPNHGLPYTQIYPFEFVPETVNDGKTFICFDADIVDVPSRTIYIPVIYIWIFTHKSRMRLDDGGLLLDQLCVEVNKQLNGSRFYGLGELKLDSVNRFVPITDYRGRVLTYYTADFNRPSGSRQIPASRKRGV